MLRNAMLRNANESYGMLKKAKGKEDYGRISKAKEYYGW